MKRIKRCLECVTLGSLLLLLLCIFFYHHSYHRVGAEETRYSNLEADLRRQADKEFNQATVDQADTYQKLSDSLADKRIEGAHRIAILILILAVVWISSLISLFVVNIALRNVSTSPPPALV